MPESIVSDRDVIFTSNFWKEFFKMQETQLRMSTTYHPQSDGLSEVLNKSLQCYLRCFCADKPKEWIKWLSWAEWCYNSTKHSSSGYSPYKIVYGRPPPDLLTYIPMAAKVQAVDDAIRSREEVLRILRKNLLKAQDRMKKFADRHRTEREFEVGMWVHLKLQYCRQGSVVKRNSNKLVPLYYDPYQILERIGKVAYRLQLPESALIHPVFHVSLLKK